MTDPTPNNNFDLHILILTAQTPSNLHKLKPTISFFNLEVQYVTLLVLDLETKTDSFRCLTSNLYLITLGLANT